LAPELKGERARYAGSRITRRRTIDSLTVAVAVLPAGLRSYLKLAP
jgi:hypothetical protein